MKYCLIIALLALAGTAATAQSRFRTDESIISQLKNGTAPALVFSTEPVAQKEIVTQPVSAEKSLGQQIRSNTVPDLPYKKETAGSNLEKELDTRAEPSLPLNSEKAVDSQKPVRKATAGQGTP